MSLAEDCDAFILSVNDKTFWSLTYKYDLTPDDDDTIQCDALIELNKNEVEVHDPWHNKNFTYEVQGVLGGATKRIWSAEIGISSCSSSAPVNEIFDTLVDLADVKRRKLQSLRLSELPRGD